MRFRQVARTAVQRATDKALRAVDAPPSLDSIQRYLDLSRAAEGDRTAGGVLLQAPRASMQSWRETLYVTIADGTAVTAAATRTILVPSFTLPANYLYPGRTLKYTLFGRASSAVTTPGTFVHSLIYGTAAGGVVLAASGAWAPETGTVATNLAWYCEYYSVCRSVGSSGTQFTMGRMSLSDYDSTSAATLRGNLGMVQFPDVPAVATVDTTTATALNPCVTNSLSTASVTAHIAILEALT
jgi:hypothetical protein